MNEAEVRGKLRTKFFGRELYHYESVGSTNDVAKKLPQDTPEGTIVVADEQTAGRGRLGRRWQSARGESLTFSIILRPEILQKHLGMMSLYASLAVAETIKEVTGIRPECKWPNDVLIGGKKCCGILSESTFERDRCTGIIVGIGININQADFPGELSSTATSLYQIRKACFSVSEILSVLLYTMEQFYPMIQQQRYEEIRSGWLQFAPMMGKAVTISTPGTVFHGIAGRIEKTGELVLLCEGKELRFSSGDLTVRIEG